MVFLSKGRSVDDFSRSRGILACSLSAALTAVAPVASETIRTFYDHFGPSKRDMYDNTINTIQHKYRGGPYPGNINYYVKLVLGPSRFATQGNMHQRLRASARFLLDPYLLGALAHVLHLHHPLLHLFLAKDDHERDASLQDLLKRTATYDTDTSIANVCA